MKIENGYSKNLKDNLILKVANDENEDLERFISFNLTVHKDESLRQYINRLYLEHPQRKRIYWIYVEENNSNNIVSAITLMPLEWNFNGIPIPICEMGLVGTLPEYRNRKLIGIMNQLYEAIMKQEGYILSGIRGIPYYYRRFGYDFALKLDERILLDKNQIPSREVDNISFQKATREDLPFIKSIYNKEEEKYFITNRFNPENFVYKFLNDDFDNNFLSTYLIKINGKLISFFSYGMSFDNVAFSLIVPEVNESCMIKILQFIKNLNEELDQFIFHVNSDTKFGQYLCSIGRKRDSGYGWQIKIPNIKEFLLAISPVLEQRIESSVFRGLSQEIVISDYRESFAIKFKNGKVRDIEVKKGYPFHGTCDLKIPGSNLIKLLLSDKNFEEIKYIIEDSILQPESEQLIEILFPKRPSNPDTYY
ncbi:MAG: GNAT family N-acetyltransferase [Candidatus Thorarchaeota archaeon]